MNLMEQVNTYRQKLTENQKILKQRNQMEQQLTSLKSSLKSLMEEKEVYS